ncbi:hypothetical protein BHE74_00031067 [Ensete ventricosum]|nr:hypothetical protein BHE74_00031067 [Ensete ventricosum]
MLGGNDRFRPSTTTVERYQPREKEKREKERENLEIRRCSPDLDPLLVGFSTLRGENLWRSREGMMHELLAEASRGEDVSSPRARRSVSPRGKKERGDVRAVNEILLRLIQNGKLQSRRKKKKRAKTTTTSVPTLSIPGGSGAVKDRCLAPKQARFGPETGVENESTLRPTALHPSHFRGSNEATPRIGKASGEDSGAVIGVQTSLTGSEWGDLFPRILMKGVY